MQLILSELHKLFIKRHFALLLAALFIFETVSLCVSLDKRIGLDEDSAEVYKAYMDEYGGELTKEKIEKIECAIEERANNEYLKKELQWKFIDGEITPDEYRSEASRLKEAAKGRDGFNRFIAAYNNAEFEGEYLADSIVWDVLLGNGGIDFFIAITVILMVIALTVYDDETGINKLKFSAKNGKSALISVQISTTVLMSVLIAAVIFAGKFIIARRFFNLDGFGNPLYSAENFVYTPLDISLLKTYIYMSVIKTAGYVYLALMTMLIGQILKSSLYTMFVSILTVYIPAYVLSDMQIKYLIPIPSSLLTAIGYFYAIEFGSFDVTEDGTMIMNTFSSLQLTVFFAAVGMIILTLIMANRLLWSKRRSFL